MRRLVVRALDNGKQFLPDLSFYVVVAVGQVKNLINAVSACDTGQIGNRDCAEKIKTIHSRKLPFSPEQFNG